MEVSGFGKLFFFLKNLKERLRPMPFTEKLMASFQAVLLSLSAVLEEMFFFRPSDIFLVFSLVI
jgi:hypothetical protein